MACPHCRAPSFKLVYLACDKCGKTVRSHCSECKKTVHREKCDCEEEGS